MTRYTTKTGFYVICDPEGRVIAKADVDIGTHLIAEDAEPSQCYDVDSAAELESIDVDSYYDDKL